MTDLFPGSIATVVKRYVPASYRAMIGKSGETDYYSLDELNSLIDYVTFKLQATIIAATEQGTVLDPTMREFLGKVATLKFIPAAMDYWLDQYQQIMLQGTHETQSFPARLQHLREIYQTLAYDVEKEFETLFGGEMLMPQVSYGDNGRGVLLTPDPQIWPQPKTNQFDRTLLPFEIGDGTGVLPWEW